MHLLDSTEGSKDFVEVVLDQEPFQDCMGIQKCTGYMVELQELRTAGVYKIAEGWNIQGFHNFVEDKADLNKLESAALYMMELGMVGNMVGNMVGSIVSLNFRKVK
jgi:hypothetical protein